MSRRTRSACEEPPRPHLPVSPHLQPMPRAPFSACGEVAVYVRTRPGDPLGWPFALIGWMPAQDAAQLRVAGEA